MRACEMSIQFNASGKHLDHLLVECSKERAEHYDVVYTGSCIRIVEWALMAVVQMQ